MAMDLMSQWILSTTVIATGSSLSSFLPIQPTRSSRSMWCCLSHFLKPTPMSSPTISIRRSLTLIKKGDFFPLFWSAWISSFTESLILKAFEATGIWPMDANVILRRFASTPDAERSSSSGLSDHDWRKLDRLVRAAFNDSHQYEARKLRSSVHHISVQYELYTLRTRA
ncbi:hypothetical protein P3342_001748 [Pyrenophora teres f. teres]|nr:hypothetical protein P3342_001748 [Pyrenophora teres f. teres]